MQHWHFNDKGKKIINDCVEKLVSHLPPRKMSNRFELVVDEQLRTHHDKTCSKFTRGKAATGGQLQRGGAASKKKKVFVLNGSE